MVLASGSSLAQVIKADGMRAYTIGVNETSGGGGHVMPGDRVDVVLTRDLTSAPGPDSINGRRFVSGIIIQNLRVLGMDQNANPSSTQPSVSHTATLEVGVVDALKLATASQVGTLSLALRKPGATEIVDVKALLTAELGLEGPAPGRAAPHRSAPCGQARPPTPPRRPAPTSSSSRATTKTSVPVSSESAAL